MELKVIWSKSARLQLKQAFDYIKLDSIVNAEKVRNGILKTSQSLHLHPKRYPADNDKIDNDGSYRSFILFRYKISYRIKESEITVLRVRHTSMEPTKY